MTDLDSHAFVMARNNLICRRGGHCFAALALSPDHPLVWQIPTKPSSCSPSAPGTTPNCLLSKLNIYSVCFVQTLELGLLRVSPNCRHSEPFPRVLRPLRLQSKTLILIKHRKQKFEVVSYVFDKRQAESLTIGHIETGMS
jgi:hypothetical protein